MAAMTIQVPDEIAEALAPLDGSLSDDGYGLACILREEVYRVGRALHRIADDGDDMPAEELRVLAERVGVLADACEELGEHAANRIGQFRRIAGLTRKQLAERIDVPPEELARWEKAGDGVAADKAEELARLFRVTCDFLMRGDA